MTASAKSAVKIPAASIRPKVVAAASLAEKLAAFDPKLHGGEAMATRSVGKEVLDAT